MPNKTSLKVVVSTVKDAIREEIGPVVLELIQEAYREKSEGKPDLTGRKWKETKRHRDHGGLIMILTRALFDSMSLVEAPNGFRITFEGVDYAKYALAKRPAWPNVNDPVWRGALARRLSQRLGEKLRVRKG